MVSLFLHVTHMTGFGSERNHPTQTS